jgi:hypothetical protein
MNHNAKVDKLLAEARELLPTEEERQRQEEFCAWWHSLVEVLRKICDILPEDLQEAFVNRIERHVDRLNEDKSVSWSEDGLFQWADKTLREDSPPIADALPVALVKAYLADPGALPCHECGDCGLIVPTDRQRKVEYFPTCPVCGGRTGLLAWFYTIHDAVKLLPYEKAFPAMCGKVRPLTVLVEAGYQVGTRLSEWIIRLPRKER